jgi:hypothetical protein
VRKNEMISNVASAVHHKRSICVAKSCGKYSGRVQKNPYTKKIFVPFFRYGLDKMGRL